MKDELNYELLADVAQIIMGQSPPSSTYNTVGEGLPFYQGKTDFGDMYPTPRVYCTEPSRIAEPDDILISVRAPVGPTNVSQERSCIGRGISAIRAGKNIDRDFLLYFLRFYEPELAKAGTGSTFAAIAREDLETIKIPLPPLTEQKRIASLLARADRLRTLRRTAHELGESLLQSVFLEMFGEYLKPSNPFTLMEKLVKITGGGTPSRDVPEYFTGNIPWLTSKDMRGNYIYDTQEHITEKAIKESATNLVPVGSILLVVKSKILMRRLPIAVTKVPLCHGQDIKSIQCSNKVNSLFLVYVLKYNEQNLLNQARGANTEGLTLPMLNEIKVPNVPLSLQEEFAGVVARVESLRRRMSEAGRQVNGLFESLLNQSFV